MVFHIKLENGHWRVNDKKLNELNPNELDFMNRFFRELKLNTIEVKKPIDSRSWQKV